MDIHRVVSCRGVSVGVRVVQKRSEGEKLSLKWTYHRIAALPWLNQLLNDEYDDRVRRGAEFALLVDGFVDLTDEEVKHNLAKSFLGNLKITVEAVH